MTASRSKKNVEATIQRHLVKWLRKEYPTVEVRYNKIENKRNALEGYMDKLLGSAVAGTPDLTLFLDRQEFTYILELELKKKDGTLNDAQKLWHKNFKETKNRKARVAYGFIEAQNVARDWVASLGGEQRI